MRIFVVVGSELQISPQKHVLRTLHVAVVDAEHWYCVLQRPHRVSGLAILFQIWLQRDLNFLNRKIKIVTPIGGDDRHLPSESEPLKSMRRVEEADFFICKLKRWEKTYGVPRS